MLFKKLSELAKIDISNVDKKSKQDEQEVKLCNFVDVYHKWALKDSMVDELMSATANDNQISRFQLHSGQVAITKDSETKDDIGMAMLVDINTPDVVLGYHCALITPDGNELSASYLNVVLHSSYAGKYFEMNASGSGQRYTLTNDIIGNFPVPMIPLKEQEAVSDVFDQINNKILTNNAIISELEDMAKDVYDYWFVQFDFPDGNGKPYKSSGGKMVWNEELKREIPEGWKADKLGCLISKISTGLNPRDNFKFIPKGIDYYTVKNLCVDGHLNISDCDHIDKSAQLVIHERSDISIGDILYASIAPLGRTYLITESPTTWEINESIFSIRPNTSKTTPEFLQMYLRSDYLIKQFEQCSVGSIFKGVRIDMLQNTIVLIPPFHIIQEYTNRIKNIVLMQHNKWNENEELTSLRDFLLPLLMNGQVKVGDMEA